MRILWFAHAPDARISDAAGIRSSRSGFWTYSLADAIADADPGGELIIASHAPVPEITTLARAGVTHVLLPERSPHDTRTQPDAVVTRQCRNLVDELAPDVVHVHGVEKNYGLALQGCDVPLVASIHGFMHRMSDGWFGGMSLAEVVRAQTWKEARRRTGPLAGRVLIRQRAELETQVLRAINAFIGVTTWDRGHVRSINPSARYWQVFPALRPEFSKTVWQPGSDNGATIFTSVAAVPWKGLHVLLRALALLRRRGWRLTLRLAGDFTLEEGGYQAFLNREIDRLELRSVVQPLGFLDAPDLAKELQGAAVAVIPSFVENFSLSLMEALAVGTPAVVSFVGGLGSVARDGVDALFFIPGDESHLAEQLERAIADPSLAHALSRNARAVALRRHEPTALVAKTLGIYAEVAAGASHDVSDPSAATQYRSTREADGQP